MRIYNSLLSTIIGKGGYDMHRLFVAILLALLAGCATANVSTDFDPGFDFSGLKTFCILYDKSSSIAISAL